MNGQPYRQEYISYSAWFEYSHGQDKLLSLQKSILEKILSCGMTGISLPKLWRMLTDIVPSLDKKLMDRMLWIARKHFLKNEQEDK